MTRPNLENCEWFVEMSNETDSIGHHRAVVRCVTCCRNRTVQAHHVLVSPRCENCRSVSIEVCLELPHVVRHVETIDGPPRFEVCCLSCGDYRVLKHGALMAPLCKSCTTQKAWDENRPLDVCENFVRKSEITDASGEPMLVFSCKDCSDELLVTKNALKPHRCLPCQASRRREARKQFFSKLNDAKLQRILSTNGQN